MSSNFSLNKNNRKAIVLLSGGLDSVLAAYIMKKQGIDLLCLYFNSPFYNYKAENFVRELTTRLNLPLKIKFMKENYLDIITSPKYGYGKNMNPCIDCRIYSFKSAKKIMNDENADFIVTGEVLGQRPMSQNLRTLKIIEEEAGLDGLILRPLSANLLQLTIPEKKDWVNKNMFFSIAGRSRKKQYELVRKFNISEDNYLSPAGGCRLTMRDYSIKLRDFFKCRQKITLKDILLLNNGRYFSISDDFKVIVGRNEAENKLLDRIAINGEIKMWAEDCVGPLCIGIGKVDENKLKITGGICGRYSDCDMNKNIRFNYQYGEKNYSIDVVPLDDRGILKYKMG